MATAISTPNIALIKYWGNRDDRLRLPAADSLSMTLESPSVTVQMEWADTFHAQSWNADGSKKSLTPAQHQRIQTHFDLMKSELEAYGITVPNASLTIDIHSKIPEGIGFASSAAVFSALATAYANLTAPTLPTDIISILARLGSGSAARSVFGGFVTLSQESGKAEQIAPETHWQLHDIIIMPKSEHKKVGSTEGHSSAQTSPLFQKRVANIPDRMRECTDAIRRLDFEKLQHVCERDALDMHEVMQTQTPALEYRTEATYEIIREVETLRKRDRLEVLYTMDAGPTVHLLCTPAAKDALQAFAGSQKNCTVFSTKIGQGSRVEK